MATWDPAVYASFGDERSRPFHDLLLARVGATDPADVVDLGCGTGALTRTLASRWPDARVVGVDSSPEMVAAGSLPGVDVRRGDVTTWTPEHCSLDGGADRWVDRASTVPLPW